MHRAWIALLCSLAACRSPKSENVAEKVPPEARRFRGTLLLRDDAVLPAPFSGSCRPVVRGSAPHRADATPEINLELRLIQAGFSSGARTDAEGVAAIGDLEAGAYVVFFQSERGHRARATILLRSRRTEILGAIQTDSDDLDGDGDRAEELLIADFSSEGEQHARWIFGANDGVAFEYRADKRETERLRLDAEGTPLESASFADLDGDFIPDESDTDKDGDGLADSEEPASLACPLFSHDPLFAAGSKHAEFSCERCHRSAEEPPLACEDCHDTAGRIADQVPQNKPQNHFARRCEACHSADESWAENNGQRHEPFVLSGQHLRADCFSCHETGDPKPQKICVDCHLEDAAADHYRGGCEGCHSADGWSPANTRHDQFPLNGGHSNVRCENCHQVPEYRGLSKECSSCHLADAPLKHESAGFKAQACDRCHEITTWTAARYGHPQWILANKHATLRCEQCHANNPTGYTGNTQACAGCHQKPTFPDHTNLGDQCERCHDDRGFTPALQGSFDHAVFPLTGAHASALCSTCHENGARPRPPQNCSACHAADRPARHTGTFDGECSSCHKPTVWTEIDPPHQHTATFPLEGAHASVSCARCHVTSYQANKACVNCHAADEPPNHYGNTCETCHTPNNWNPSGSMNHHTVDPNAFPLDGGHAAVLCSQCHTNGFTALPRTCESCHRNTAPVGHAGDGCARCHSSGAWSPATSPPRNALHPLSGGHTSRTCVSCHGVYSAGNFATPRPNAACSTCHSLPAGHIATGTTPCQSCHSVNAFVPAQGGHTGTLPSANFPYPTWSRVWFTIPHHGARQCNTCHTQSAQSGFAFYSCTTNCHRNQNDLDDRHRGESLYHFSPLEPNNPPNQGGAVWPTGHVGCVNNGCHPRG